MAAAPKQVSQTLNAQEIARILPHAAPMLLVDRVIELDPGRSGKGIKNITANDPLLTGHFPGRPIMPGVLIVEACGQLAAIVCATESIGLEPVHELEAAGEKAVEILAMIERFKFVRLVTPGDQLVLEAKIGRRFEKMIRIEVSARVGQSLVADGILVATRG